MERAREIPDGLRMIFGLPEWSAKRKRMGRVISVSGDTRRKKTCIKKTRPSLEQRKQNFPLSTRFSKGGMMGGLVFPLLQNKAS